MLVLGCGRVMSRGSESKEFSFHVIGEKSDRWEHSRAGHDHVTRGARQCTTKGACAVGETFSTGPAVREVQEACVRMQPLCPASTDSTHAAESEG